MYYHSCPLRAPSPILRLDRIFLSLVKAITGRLTASSFVAESGPRKRRRTAAPVRRFGECTPPYFHGIVQPLRVAHPLFAPVVVLGALLGCRILQHAFESTFTTGCPRWEPPIYLIYHTQYYHTRATSAILPQLVKSTHTRTHISTSFPRTTCSSIRVVLTRFGLSSFFPSLLGAFGPEYTLL